MKRKSEYNLRAIMLESTYRKKIYSGALIAASIIAGFSAIGISSIVSDDGFASQEENPAAFEVNVQDALAVAVTTADNNATGNVNEFLRNQVDISINSNVSNGFVASMFSRNNTSLTHTILGSSYYIPSVSASTSRGSFPVNNWGYSLKSASLDGKTYGETDAGNNNSMYYPLTANSANPILVLSANAGTKSGTQSIYFGAKADTNKPSGTYSNTVVISVVTGVINATDNPITPTDPVTPSTDPNPSDQVPVISSSGVGTSLPATPSASRVTTVYTGRSSNSGSGTTTTTTEVSAGDHTGSYAPAQGVSVTTQTNIVEGGSMLPIGLAATSIATATAGVIFFVLAKRDEDDEDEEEDLI